MKKLYFSLLTLFFFFGANAQIINFTDPNFKAKLLSANPTNQIASVQIPNSPPGTLTGTVTTYNSIDTNDDGEIQVSEAALIKYLDIGFSGVLAITNLDEISNFTNLQSLSCPNNQLISLNLSGLTNLKYLYCPGNQLTNLNVSGLTNFIVLTCYNNQISSLNVNDLTNLNTLYCHSNQLTSLNISSLPNLITLQCGGNQLSSLSLSDLPNLRSLSCYNNQLSSLNLNGLPKLWELNCQNNPLTSLYIKNGNSQSLSLSISGNPNLVNICADDADLNYVQTRVNLAGYSATCNVSSYCSFTPGGTFYTIQGTNTFDGNSNGCDVIDGFYPNLKFSITDGINSGSLISNSSGNYSIPVSAGSYMMTPLLESYSYFAVSPTSTSVSFPATVSPSVQNFCVTPNGVHHDLEVVAIPLGPARPGFDATYKIKYKNKGTVFETTTLVFNYNDAILDLISSTLTPTTASTGSLSWNIGTLIPFQSGEIVVTLNVNSPMEIPGVIGGDILNYTAVINGLFTDETPVDNTFLLLQTVVNAYDPNDKTCLEGTTINPTMIGEYVHYLIRFENTGTYPAQNIVVKDMIDTTKFNILTLEITDASHSCVTRITNPNKVEFIFEDINLPFDDATNDGYVVFKIKTKSTLVVGNTISNLANIYFDYNFPIVTNTATSTFQTLANNTFKLDNYLSLSPNPAKDILNLNFQDFENIQSISIYNMLGQLVQITTNPSNSINVADLKTGNYIIKLHTEQGEISGKFIKE